MSLYRNIFRRPREWEVWVDPRQVSFLPAAADNALVAEDGVHFLLTEPDGEPLRIE